MYIDITKKWHSINKKGSFSFKNEVFALDKKYTVGDNGVKQTHTEREIEIGRILANTYNFCVEMLPDITGAKEQQNIRMADCLLDGISYEIKRICSNGNYTIMHAIRNAKGQANNIILDITIDIDSAIIEDSIKKIYNNRFCDFVDICVIMKNDKVLKVYKKIRADLLINKT